MTITTILLLLAFVFAVLAAISGLSSHPYASKINLIGAALACYFLSLLIS